MYLQGNRLDIAIDEILIHFLSLGLPRNVINVLTSDLKLKIFDKEFPTIV